MVRFSSLRAGMVLCCLGVTFVALIVRVGYLQTSVRDQIIRQADRQQHRTETLYARRGSIFDANGMLMAGTVQTTSLFIDPKFMLDQFQSEGRSLIDLDRAIDRLAEIIDRDPLELHNLLADRSTSRFIRIADHLDEPTIQAIRALRLPGAGFTYVNERYYPMGSIAAHVLGGVGTEGVGLEGLELRFERLLAGRNGYQRVMKDARRRPIAATAEDYLPPLNGQHLILTIDAHIQMIVEQELAAQCVRFGAKRGEAVVLDPRNGDILAMANWPTFNPQNLADSTPDLRRNRCVTDPFEPGSIIKPFIVGPAIAWNISRAGEVFPINGPTHVTSYGRRITDVHPYRALALWDVLVKSSNVGMSMLATRMGNANLHRALSSSGFGQRTGVDLPGEDPGLVNPLARWSKYSTDSVAQGYEMMVTPLQMARAMAIYANGGRLVTPRIVKGVLDENGQIISKTPETGLSMLPEVVDPITAAQVKRILADVPVRGTAQRARSQTYTIFGKTGTAHSARGGSYNDSNYTSSFVGGAPAENPRVVIAFHLHDTDKSKGHYGGLVSAPGAGRALERICAYLQVPASPPLPLPPPHVADVLYAFDPKVYEPRRNRSIASVRD